MNAIVAKYLANHSQYSDILGQKLLSHEQNTAWFDLQKYEESFKCHSNQTDKDKTELKNVITSVLNDKMKFDTDTVQLHTKPAILTTITSNAHLLSYGSQIGQYLWLACLTILLVYLFCKVHMALGAKIANPVIHTSVASSLTTCTIQAQDSILTLIEKNHHLLTSAIIVVVILWIIGKCIYLCTIRN